MSITIKRYNGEQKNEWDTFIKNAKNATFLFERDYMDYHADRFTDCSFMFYKENSLVAVLPASIDKSGKTIQSHGGLTYGGLVMSRDTRSCDVIEIFTLTAEFIKYELKAERLHYKPLPYIYCSQPSDEPLYALFKMNATLLARTISTTIETRDCNTPSQLRMRGAKKAIKAGIKCCESSDFDRFWKVLTSTLKTQHSCTPVHTAEEIIRLSRLFPKNIKLFTAMNEEKIVAGTVVYHTGHVAHLQYIAASPEGKKCGALDALILYIMQDVYKDTRYIDFGISTENAGQVLNRGLIQQKEGFGGRAIVYDTYEIKV